MASAPLSLEAGTVKSAPLQSSEQANSQFNGQSLLNIKELPEVKMHLDIINDPLADPLVQRTSYDQLKAFTNDFVIDADTFRGKTIGIADNVRSSLIDALEDPNKNKNHTPDIDIGTTATQKVKDTLLNDLLLVQDQKVGMFLEGKTDSRNDKGRARELGFIVSQFKENPAEATIDAMLLEESDAVRYLNKDESLEDFRANRTSERNVLVDAYKKSISPKATSEDQNRFDRLIKKSRYVDKSYFDDIAESGWGTSPLDVTNSVMSGLGNMWGQVQNAQAVGAGSLGEALDSDTLRDLSKASYSNARKAKEAGGYYDKLSERGGLLNQENLNEYDINLIEHMWARKDITDTGDFLQTASKGIVQGLPEIAVSSNPLGATLFATTKAADIAVEQNGGSATVLDSIKTLPNAVAYTMLNRVEGSLLANKIVPTVKQLSASAAKALSNPTAKRILALTAPVGKVALTSGVEGLAEAGQSLTENVKPGKLPTRVDLIQARNEGLAGMGGGVSIGTAQTVMEKGGTALAKNLTKNMNSENLLKAVSSTKERLKAKQTKQASPEIQTQVVDFDAKVETVSKDDEILTQTVLFANEYESGMQEMESKLAAKLERYETALSKGKTEGGVEITPELEDKMRTELNVLREKEAAFKKDKYAEFNKKIAKDIKSKYKHLDQTGLDQAVSRRETILSELESIESPTDKQAFLADALRSEISSIEKIKPKEATVDKAPTKLPVEKPVSTPTKETSKDILDDLDDSDGAGLRGTPKGKVDEATESKPETQTETTPETNETPQQVEAREATGEGGWSTPDQRARDAKDRIAKYNNLSKADKAWMENFDTLESQFKRFKPSTRTKRLRLLEESQTPIVKKQSQASKAQEAAQATIGGSEADAAQAVKDVFKKEYTPDSQYENMSEEDLNEINRADAEAQARKDERYVHGHNEKSNMGEDFYVDSIIDNGDGTHTIKPTDWNYSITVNSETGMNEKGTWTFFFDAEDADNYVVSDTNVGDTDAQYDASATMEAAEAATPKGAVEYNSNSIVDQTSEGTKNIYTETDLYDLFNDKDAFVSHMENMYPNSSADFSGQFDIAKALYEPLEGQLQNITAPRRKDENGELQHFGIFRTNPANELALGKVGGKLVFDKSFMQTLFAVGYPTVQIQSTELQRLNDEDIAKRYGIKNQDDFNEIRQAGAGMTKLAKAVGNDVLKELGLGKGLSQMDKDALAGDIGLMLLTSMDNLGLITKTTLDLKGGEKKTSFVKFKEDFDTELINGMSHLTAAMAWSELHAPASEPAPVSESFSMSKGPGLESGEEITESMNIRQSNGNTINWDLLKEFENLTEEQQNVVLKLQDPGEVQATFKESVIAKNNGIKMYHSRGQVFIDSLRGTPDQEFFFTEGYSLNARSNVLEDTFNYQLDKTFARHLTNINESEMLTSDGEAVFKASVLLALGNKPEYMTLEDIEAEYAAIEPMTMEEIVEMSGKEEGMMTFHALTEMNKAKIYEAKNGSLVGFDTHLSSEIDGVTNGPAFLAFQAGITNWDIFNKVGVFGEEFGSLAAYKAAGNSDVYVTINDIVQEKLSNITSGRDGVLVEKMSQLNMFDRNMAKKPVMVFGYGMSIKGIKVRVAEAMITKMIEKLVSENANERKAANEVLSMLGFTGDLTNRAFTGDEIFGATRGLDTMSTLYTDALEDQFGDILEYTDNIKAISGGIFEIYQSIFAQDPELNQLMQTIYTGTPAEKKVAEKALAAIVPSLGMYSLSDDQSVYNNQPLIKNETKSTSKTIASRNSVSGGWTVKEQVTAPSDGSKLAPIYIHGMDSTNMSIATIGVNYSSQGKYGAQNIFDAIISGMNILPAYGQAYNEGFFQMNKDHSVAEEMVTSAQNILAIAAKYKVSADMITDLENDIVTMQNTTLKKRETMMRDIIPKIQTVAQMNGLPGVAFQVNNKTRVNYGDEKAFTGGKAKPTDAAGVTKAYNELLEDSTMSPEMEKSLGAIMERAVDVLYSKLKMSVETGKKKTAGMFDFAKDEIFVATSNHTVNKAAVFAHEVIHSITTAAIDDEFGYAYRDSLQRLADKVTSYMTDNRGKLIKDGTFKSYREINELVKWINASPEHEIIAYGLTNEGLMKILKGMPIADPKSANAFQWIFNLLRKIFKKASVMFGIKSDISENEYNKLFATYVQLSRINKNIKDQTDLNVKLKATYTLMDSLNEGLSKVIIDKSMKAAAMVGMNSTNYNKLKNVSAEWSEQYKWLDFRNNKTLQSFAFVFSGSGNQEVDVALQEISAEHTNDIERGSNNLKQIAIKHIQELLDNPTVETETAIKRSLIDTGIIDLYTVNEMSMDDVVKVIREPKFRAKLLKEQNDNLRNYLSKDKQYKTTKLLIDGLVHFMATGQAAIPSLKLNATKIAEHIGDMNPELIRNIDAILSLQALTSSTTTVLDTMTKAQVKGILGYANQAALEAEPLFDGMPENKMKGYSYNAFNDQSEIMFISKDVVDADSSQLDNLIDLGWTVYEANDNVIKLKNRTPKATWQQGFFAILDSGKKGFSRYVKPSEVATSNNMLEAMARTGQGIKPGSNFAIYEVNRDNVSKRFIMSKGEMRQHLDLEERVSHVLGNTTSRLHRKNKSRELNAQMINLLEKDYREASDYDKAKKFDTIVLKPVKTDFATEDAYYERMKLYENQRKDLREISDLIPSNIRESVKDLIHVRKRIGDIVFGYRELSLGIAEDGFLGSTITKTLSPKSLATMNKVGRVFDYHWKNFVKFAKERMVVLSPIVHVGNFMSNVSLLTLAGVPVAETFKRFKQSYVALENYRDDTESWIRAQVQADAGVKGAQAKADKYKAKMEANPVNESITNGLFSFIVEDVANELTIEKNSVKEMFGKTIRGAVEVGKRTFHIESSKDVDGAMKRVYVDVDTQEGIELMKLFQYSDFIAKDALYHHNMEKGMTKQASLKQANDMFIDYRYNDSALLSYMNATAIFPFSKFAIRIQPILAQLAIDRPASLSIALVLQGYILDDTIVADNFVFKTHFALNMLHGFGQGVDPMDLLTNPFTDPFV